MSSMAQQFQLEDIFEDIYSQLEEYGIPIEDVSEQLMDIVMH